MSTRPLTKQFAFSFVVLCLLAVGFVTALPAQTNVQDGIEVIDLRSWRDQKGQTLADVNQGRSMALVLLVSPNCDTCAKAKTSIEDLRERAKKAGMGYYVLMIPDGTDTQKYFSYADSLKIDAESFVWSNADVKAPASLTTTPAPYHILLTNEGLVVNKWAGVPSSVSTQ